MGSASGCQIGKRPKVQKVKVARARTSRPPASTGQTQRPRHFPKKKNSRKEKKKKRRHAAGGQLRANVAMHSMAPIREYNEWIRPFRTSGARLSSGGSHQARKAEPAPHWLRSATMTSPVTNERRPIQKKHAKAA